MKDRIENRLSRHFVGGRRLVGMVLLMLLVGTTFYSVVEGWSILDAFYFSVVTLATVGFGDLVPTQPVSKAFTAVYILAGVGLLTTLIRRLALRTVVPDETTEPSQSASAADRLELAKRLRGDSL